MISYEYSIPGSKKSILAWLAWDVTWPSGTYLATQTAPSSKLPFEIISRTQASLGSTIENDSPSEAYPYYETRSVITLIASLAVLDLYKAIIIKDP